LVILAAAHDLLSPVESHDSSAHQNATSVAVQKPYNRYDCNEISTGIVLIADILPGLFIKLLYSAFPYNFKYSHRVAFIVTLSALSFLLISFSFNHYKWLMFAGIGLASVSTSFGEMTFLAMTTLYPKHLAFFPYAVGLALTGLVSSSSYAALTVKLRPDQAILAMSFIPFLMALSYLLMPTPDQFISSSVDLEILEKEKLNAKAQNLPKLDTLNFSGKLKILIPLLKYMIPLFLVFFSEYVINQGLFELIFFKDNYLLQTHSSQYR
jgi:battenin